MTRARIAAVITALAVGALAGCGSGDDESESERPPEGAERPALTAGCSPLEYGGDGQPERIIAASTALQGQFSDHGIQVSQALKLVLDQRDWRAGDYTVGLRICNEANASDGLPTPKRCKRNAREFARDERVTGVVGPQFSGCTQAMLPILNRAQPGPMPVIGYASTYLGLTRAGPGVAPGDPERYYPTGTRNYARVIPPDDAQAATGALFVEQQGARRAFVLTDPNAGDYGKGLAEAFGTVAERTGVRIVGTASWRPSARGYRPLAQRIRRARADAVYLAGYVSSNGPRLIKDLRATLGPDAELLGPDGFNQPTTIVEGAGPEAEGFLATIATLPNEELPAAGREFAGDFEERFSQRPCCVSVQSAQAMQLILDALERSDGSRPQVNAELLDTGVQDRLLGEFGIDRFGDMTLTTHAVYRIEDGRLRFAAKIAPSGEFLTRE